MTETSSSPAPGPEEAGLALSERGSRFVDDATEVEYLSWQALQSVPFNRSGMLGGAVVGAVQAVLFYVERPAGILPWMVVLLCVWAALVIALVESRRSALAASRWIQQYLVVTNGTFGVATVALLSIHLGLVDIAFGATIACFFGTFAANRLRPLQGVVATAPIGIVHAVLATLAVRSGEISMGSFALHAIMLPALYGGAFQVSLATDAGLRQSFRQQRIIERQQVIIAGERAQSEALLKQELSHQVAERSRELGAVFAKSDVTLDVRRLTPGERFDTRYKIVAAIGAGGMGAVFEVERLTDGLHLALKAVVGEVSGPSAARFAREAEIGARMHHPNLVSIVDVGVSEGVPFLVMELVRGGSLESKRERFGDVAWAVPILRQVAEALSVLHETGIVHRDLKPANVLLVAGDAAPVAKISDFGISRFAAPLDEGGSIDPNAATIGPSQSPKPHAHALTGTGVVMGTPLYMAPEAARGGRALGTPADVFALGIMAYEVLTGHAPFAVPPVLLAMAEQPIPAVRPIDDPRVPTSLRAAILECLVADPAKRPRVRDVLSSLPR